MEYTCDVQGRHLVNIQPPAKDQKEKNHARQKLCCRAMDLHQCCRCSRNIAEVTSKIIHFNYQKNIFTGSKYNTIFIFFEKNFIGLHQRYIVFCQFYGKTSLYAVVTRYIRSYCIICVWYALFMLLFPLLTIVLMMSFTHTLHHAHCLIPLPLPMIPNTLKTLYGFVTNLKWSDKYKVI